MNELVKVWANKSKNVGKYFKVRLEVGSIQIMSNKGTNMGKYFELRLEAGSNRNLAELSTHHAPPPIIGYIQLGSQLPKAGK